MSPLITLNVTLSKKKQKQFLFHRHALRQKKKKQIILKSCTSWSSFTELVPLHIINSQHIAVLQHGIKPMVADISRPAKLFIIYVIYSLKYTRIIHAF